MLGIGLSGMEVGAIISSLFGHEQGGRTESKTRTDSFPSKSTEGALPILSIMSSCDGVAK
jgi:hypothetical protein